MSDNKIDHLREVIDPILNEAMITSRDTSKDSLINYITSQFYRAANSAPGDDRRLLLLVAALSVLSSSDSGVAVAAARKIAQINPRRR